MAAIATAYRTESAKRCHLFELTLDDFERYHRKYQPADHAKVWLELPENEVFRLNVVDVMPSKYKKDDGSDIYSALLHLSNSDNTEIHVVWAAPRLADELSTDVVDFKKRAYFVRNTGKKTGSTGKKYHSYQLLRMDIDDFDKHDERCRNELRLERERLNAGEFDNIYVN